MYCIFPLQGIKSKINYTKISRQLDDALNQTRITNVMGLTRYSHNKAARKVFFSLFIILNSQSTLLHSTYITRRNQWCFLDYIEMSNQNIYISALLTVKRKNGKQTVFTISNLHKSVTSIWFSNIEKTAVEKKRWS